MIALNALVVRAVALHKRESAFEARDRLWRSVERHEHVTRGPAGGVVRCELCGAILMGLVS